MSQTPYEQAMERLAERIALANRLDAALNETDPAAARRAAAAETATKTRPTWPRRTASATPRTSCHGSAGRSPATDPCDRKRKT